MTGTDGIVNSIVGVWGGRRWVGGKSFSETPMLGVDESIYFGDMP